MREVASSSDNAWNVNLNTGNVNWNNRNNYGFVVGSRLVPAGECRDAEQISLSQLRKARRLARKNKKPSENQLSFDSQWLSGLLELQRDLNARTWTPKPSTLFVTTRPKAREIHAPDYSDRIVHHLGVPVLDAIYERIFIHESFANRRGKGTLAAVEWLQKLVRQVEDGEGGGYYLQLDVRNFFASIHRPTLYALLKKRMERHGVPEVIQRVVHALLRRSPTSQGVIVCAGPRERAQVPAYKRLENAPPGCGLPIGSLPSQFMANVYLHELDHFVKHVLKVRRYDRYVDDLVIVHRDRAQLEAWKVEIERFLLEKLRLTLKPDYKLRPLHTGIDFLGYVVYPRHTAVRRRVVGHARERLHAWGARHVRDGVITATPGAFRQIVSQWSSTVGHFKHADSFRLRQSLHRQFPWLHAATARRRFHHHLEDRAISIPLLGTRSAGFRPRPAGASAGLPQE